MCVCDGRKCVCVNVEARGQHPTPSSISETRFLTELGGAWLRFTHWGQSPRSTQLYIAIVHRSASVGVWRLEPRSPYCMESILLPEPSPQSPLLPRLRDNGNDGEARA